MIFHCDLAILYRTLQTFGIGSLHCQNSIVLPPKVCLHIFKLFLKLFVVSRRPYTIMIRLTGKTAKIQITIRFKVQGDRHNLFAGVMRCSIAHDALAANATFATHKLCRLLDLFNQLLLQLHLFTLKNSRMLQNRFLNLMCYDTTDAHTYRQQNTGSN